MASVTGFMAGGIFGLFVGVFVSSAIFEERNDKEQCLGFLTYHTKAHLFHIQRQHDYE